MAQRHFAELKGWQAPVYAIRDRQNVDSQYQQWRHEEVEAFRVTVVGAPIAARNPPRASGVKENHGTEHSRARVQIRDFSVSCCEQGYSCLSQLNYPYESATRSPIAAVRYPAPSACWGGPGWNGAALSPPGPSRPFIAAHLREALGASSPSRCSVPRLRRPRFPSRKTRPSAWGLASSRS